MRGTTNVKLRPIKFAFLVNPNDSKSLAKALELNSSLWGGSYNPIIPTFQKIPAVWRKKSDVFGHTSKTILKGYIDAFNPDFLVPLGECKKIKLDQFTQEVLDEKEVVVSIEDGTPNYGVGIFEVLKGFFDKELKFKRKYPIDFICPSIPRQNKLFFESIFGVPRKEIQDVLNEHWKEALGAREGKVNFENYLTLMLSFSIKKLLRFEIEATNNSGWHKGECIFLMDASNNHDIIDYWNLRAMGWSALPIPIQAMHLASVKIEAQKFIEEVSGVNKHNTQIYYHCTLMKSRSIDDKHIKDFADSLVVTPDEKASGSRFSIQHWYPRMWDEWARDKDGVGYCDLESKTKSYDFNNDSDEISIKTLDPKFAFRFGGHGSSSRFANDIETSNYSYDDLYANVIPEGGINLNRALSSINFLEWRFSKKGSTYLSKFKNWTINIKLPKADDVFVAWMKDQGLEINLSAPGRIAKQMIKHLGGIHGANTLANEHMISLLKAMESGKEMNKDQFWGEISKIASIRTYKRDASEILKHYVERKMFQLGVTLQCPTCTHNSWYDIKALNYVVTCTNCLEEFDIPTHSPNDIKWAYKTSGPFGLPKRAEGVYPTLLTLRFFSSLSHHSPVTPMLSFETKIKGVDMEIDLGLFFRKSQFRREEETRVIFAECKSENSFEKKDIDKMKLVAEKFPGAILVFATLKEELNKKEIALLKPLVNRCRRYYKNEEPYNPVMILTKTELFAEWDLYEAWKNKGGKHATFGDRNRYDNEIFSVCDATQQLYLGMKPWGDFIHEQFEKRRQRLSKKPVSAT
ncbi:MAG: hypothetical protein AAB784_03485 [Patescibacteria group bacterium]